MGTEIGQFLPQSFQEAYVLRLNFDDVCDKCDLCSSWVDVAQFM